MQGNSLSSSQDIESTYTRVSAILLAARSSAWQAVNAAMVTAYWEVGKTIVEEEQQGNERAEYGERVLQGLSERLTCRGAISPALDAGRPEHPEVAYPLHGLANLYARQKNYTQAEPLFRLALYIYEQQLGPEHPQIVYSLSSLALLYFEQGKYTQAEPLFQRALRLWEQAGSDHPDMAESLHYSAVLREMKGAPQEALVLYQQALAIREQTLGLEHPETRTTHQHLIALKQSIGQETAVSPQGATPMKQSREDT